VILNRAASAALGTVVLAMSVYLWRTGYVVTDWSAIALGPLAIMLFIGLHRRTVALYRARLHAELRADSRLARIMTGNLRAIFVSTAFVLVAVPLIAWQALSASSAEIIGFTVLSYSAGLATLLVQDWLQRDFQMSFALFSGVSIGANVIACAFVPVLAWINWSFVYHPGEFHNASFFEAVTLGLQQLPRRRGGIAEIMAFFYAIEAAKLWLVLQLGSSPWAAVLFSLDTALVGFIVAQVSAILTDVVHIFREEHDAE
jgi:hypothetical protein